MSMKYLLVLLLLQIGFHRGFGQSSDSFEAIIFSNEVVVQEVDSRIFFPVTVKVNERKLFRSMMFGIKVSEIAVNGNRIEPEETHLFFSEKYSYTLTTEADYYSYIGFSDMMVFVKDFDENGPVFEKYALPQRLDKIEVKYWPRYSDGELGPLHSLKVRRQYKEE